MLGGKKTKVMKIKLTEEQYDKIIRELYKSTYNSAAAKAMEKGDEDN